MTETKLQRNMQMTNLDPFYMEKSCPGQEGHPPSRVNFTERLYEKKSLPLCPSQELTFQ